MNSGKTGSGIPANGKRYLISTRTCPNCNMVKKMLQEAHVDFTPLLAEENEGAELARKFNICAVPTLIDETGSETKLLYNVNEIKTYIDRLQG
jgi:ribonucleoside-triphosphate reductase